MSAAEPGGRDPGPAARKPSSVLVGGILVLLVAIILGGGLFLSRRGEPPVRTATAAPAVQPTAQTVPAPQGASVPPASASITANSPAGSSASSASPSASLALPVASTPLEREIEAAYLHYWDVRSQAYLTLDTSHLSEVMAGAELDRALKQIADLKVQHRAVKIQVDHRIALVKVAPDQATVADEYLNKNVYVNTDTGQEPPTSDPPNTVKVAFQMTKSDGAWKVVDASLYG